jgi:hypothetical protein
MFEIAAGIFIAFAVLCIVAFAVAICADAWATSPHPTRRQMREAIDRYGKPTSNSTRRRLMSDDDPRQRN